MLVSNEPLVNPLEIEAVDTAFDAVTVSSTFSSSKGSTSSSTSSSKGSNKSNTSRTSSNNSTSDINVTSNRSSSASRTSISTTSERGGNGNVIAAINNDNNGNNGSKASLASTKSSQSSLAFQLPDAGQRFRLQVAGGSRGSSSDTQFYRQGANGQKAFIPLPKQLQDYIPKDVWEVFCVAIMAPLSHGASRENLFAIRMQVMTIFIPCVFAWFATIIWGRRHHQKNKMGTCLFVLFTGIFWALVSCTGIKYSLRITRRNMETKTFRMIDHSTRHWEPIFRGLGWNVTFQVDDDSTRRTDPTKSYLVFEPVGSLAVKIADQV